jgi:ribonuclease J
VHGEYRHLKRHAQLCEDLGVPAHNILIPDIGNCVELTEKSLKLGENVQAGARLIDGEGVEDYGTSEVMKDRLKMSSDGIVIVSLAVTGNYVASAPLVRPHGVSLDETAEAEVRAIVCRAVENYDYEQGDKNELSYFVTKTLKNYFYKKTKQCPLIDVSVLDV